MATLVGFFEWLGKHKSLRNPVGEFARTAARDPSFPREIASLEAVLEYLKGPGKGSPETIAYARNAYRAYERSVKPPSRI